MLDEFKVILHLEDILLYTDDILILCNSVGQLKKVIKRVEDWSQKNGMTLNKKKPAIVPYAPQRAKVVPFLVREKDPKSQKKTWKAARLDFLGVPILVEYKYLGVILHFKLLLERQLNHIRKKSAWIFIKLSPYLAEASAESRRDMWTTMIVPLFEGLRALMSSELSVSIL